MSIVKYMPETPNEGATVYADNGNFSSDRAIYKDGFFIGGGEFPVSPYEMRYVTKWFDMREYEEHHKGVKCFPVSFDVAESLC